MIVVDQNDDDRLGADRGRLCARACALRRLRSSVRNANHARNLGLRHARGEIVTFPDDDCLYPPGVLDRVDAAFAAIRRSRVLTGPAASPAGGLGSGRWRAESGPIDLANVWTSVIEFNLFLRRDAALALGGFDEGMGPGTPLRLGRGQRPGLPRHRARACARATTPRCASSIPTSGCRMSRWSARNATGAASASRCGGNGAPAVRALTFLVRPLGGVAASLLRGRMHDAGYYWMTFRGRLAGMLAPRGAPPRRARRR